MKKCDFTFCDNEAEYYGPMDDVVCEECMVREVEIGESTYEEYEKIRRLPGLAP